MILVCWCSQKFFLNLSSSAVKVREVLKKNSDLRLSPKWGEEGFACNCKYVFFFRFCFCSNLTFRDTFAILAIFDFHAFNEPEGRRQKLPSVKGGDNWAEII